MELLDALRRTSHPPLSLIEQGDTVLVAVSGGADSLSLLHALYSLRDELSLAGLFAAHFHHGLRGAEADSDTEFVEAFCAERGIPCVVGHGDIRALAQENHVTIQQAARTARYAFLNTAADTLKANKVATAHTRTDQAETVLLNIIRGTGLEGLQGIPERRERAIRPLLLVSREQVENYCAVNGLTPCQDQSNFDTEHYTRNHMRGVLLPLLEQRYNPQVREAVLRLSQIATADADYLRAQALSTLPGLTVAQNSAQYILSTPKLAALHPALTRAALRAALADLRGTREGLTFSHIELLCEAIGSPPVNDFTITLPEPHCTARVSAETVTLALPNTSIDWLDECVPLSVPGQAALPIAGWVVHAAHDSANTHPEGALQAVLDADRINLPSLAVRTWRKGDTIAPLGLRGRTKKLSDLFIDAKVHRPDRHRLPVVTDRTGVLWVAGLTVSEHARLTDNTRRRLALCATQYVSAEIAGNSDVKRE